MKYFLFSIFVLLASEIFAQKIKQLYVIENDEYNNAQAGKSIDFSTKINLQYRQNTIHIEYENKDSLITQLQPIQSDNYANQNKSAFFSHLEGGEYHFYLKNAKTKRITDSFHFSIEQPFYKKWWFFIIVLVYIIFMVGVIFYLFFNYRFRQQTKLQKVRFDIASDLHDDVGATLSAISFFGEMMRNKVLKNAPPEEVLTLLEKVISTSKETIETMRGVVWTINPDNDTATDFFQKLRTFGKEMLAAKNITFHFEATGFENQKLPLDVQRNLFLFYKECINNIAKHSKATQVEFLIKALPSGEGWVGLSDNGIGFNPADLHEGHGLKSLRKRAEELEGKLEITSAVGQGTSIKLEFPAP